MPIINRFINTHIAWLTPLVLTVGILLHGLFGDVQWLIPFLFVIITFLSSTGVHVRDVTQAIAHPLPVFITLFVSIIITPVVALIVASIAFSGNEAYLTGTVFAFLIPTAVASVLWVTMNKGNIALVLFIIVLHTAIVPAYLPVFLYLFLDVSIVIAYGELARGLFLILVLPSLAGIVSGHLFRKTVTRLNQGIQLTSKLALFTIIMINGSVVAPVIYAFNAELALVLLSVFSISVMAYGLGFLFARLFRLTRPDTTAVFFAAGMRNIGAGSGLAAIFFPPAVVLPVIAGTLFQQILASQMSRFLQKTEPDPPA